MTLEQIVRETLSAIEAHNLSNAGAYTADNLTVNDPTLKLSHPLDKRAFFSQMDAILQAFPDWKYNVRAMTTQNDQVIATVEATATHTNPLQLPGMPSIPATGKRISVPDQFIFTLKDNRITAITIDSPANGGAAEMLRQLGITLPPRSA
jgi:predicted ester cyclase